MSNKVFVGGLSWNTVEGGLEAFLAEAGAIKEVKIIKDRDTGRSRGFGFVTFQDSQSANQAVEMFNGRELDGRVIKVNIAEERQGSGGGQGGGQGRRDSRPFRGGNSGGNDKNRW